MAQVVYRGTAYDTEKRLQAMAQEQQQPHTVVVTYRGSTYTKEVK